MVVNTGLLGRVDCHVFCQVQNGIVFGEYNQC